MIIFDLETLADDSHRRHFIENPRKSYPADNLWEPEYESYYAACDKDKVIYPTWIVFRDTIDTHSNNDIQVWSSHPESYKEKYGQWIQDNKCPLKEMKLDIQLKMRPEGDKTPWHELKERWLNDRILGQYCNLCYGSIDHGCPCKNRAINFVFDKDPESIQMWKRRGVFVFNCEQ